jgi:hypothetical protein
MKCPVCDASVIEHPTIIDGLVFECPEHGRYGVSGTVLDMGFEDMDAWKRQSALDNARTHMRFCDRLPVIKSYHL